MVYSCSIEMGVFSLLFCVHFTGCELMFIKTKVREICTYQIYEMFNDHIYCLFSIQICIVFNFGRKLR